MTNTAPKPTATAALDATYAAITRVADEIPTPGGDPAADLAALASLAGVLHHQAELEGTTP